MLTLLLTSMLTLAFKIQQVRASGTLDSVSLIGNRKLITIQTGASNISQADYNWPIPTIISVTGEAVGTGDGSTTVFDLHNKLVEPESETIFINASVVFGYSIDYPNGRITFVKAPGKGDVIMADYKYRKFDEQQTISGTLGEWRKVDGNVFHTGVDIVAAAGTKVYAVDSDVAEHPAGYADVVKVGNKWYGHLTNRIAPSTAVTAYVTVIGEVAKDHLHFADTDPANPDLDHARNPLATGRLSPFIDTASPVVTSVEATQNGLPPTYDGVPFVTPYIYGKVDIKSNAYDSIGGYSPVGVYKIGYYIENWETGDIGWLVWNIIFDTNPPNANFNSCYAAGSSDTVYIYWVTNNPFAVNPDDYWNTKQKAGADKNVDADKNTEARFWDGEYNVVVDAQDISGGEAIRGAFFRVDNFPPSVDSVAPFNGAVNVPVITGITVTFSEKMNRASVENAFTLTETGGGTVAGTFTWSTIAVGTALVDKMVFKPSGNLKFKTSYEAKIDASAKDLADKTLGSPYTWTFKTAMVGDITGPENPPGSKLYPPDGKVDIRDIALVAKYFGKNVPPAPPICDITGPAGVPDGKIDIRDIATVAQRFGQVDP